MAKTKTAETPTPTVTQSTELATRDTVALAEQGQAVIEALRRAAGQGLSDTVGQDEIRPPRIALCQANSPQRKRNDPKFIPDLQEGQMFDDISGDILGEGPIRFVVIRELGVKGMQFAPFDQGGGVLDFDVPLTDPRMAFTDGPNGKREKPIATKFVEFLVWLPERYDVAVISFKGMSLKAATVLSTTLRRPMPIGDEVVERPPVWARMFELTSALDTKNSYTFGVFRVKPAGRTDLETIALVERMAKNYEKATITVEREHPEEAAADGPF